VTNDEFLAQAERTVFRLETLDQYLGTSDAALRHHAETGRLLPLEQRPAKVAWMDAVRRAVAAGRRVARVHVIGRPLSAYNRFELAAYAENAAAGEDVRIADRGEHPELAALDRDFWLMDEGLALLMSYDAEGRFLAMEPTTDPEVLARCRRERDLAWARSVPLDEFAATVGSGPAR
jgi:hypothetical protein